MSQGAKCNWEMICLFFFETMAMLLMYSRLWWSNILQNGLLPLHPFYPLKINLRLHQPPSNDSHSKEAPISRTLQFWGSKGHLTEAFNLLLVNIQIDYGKSSHDGQHFYILGVVSWDNHADKGWPMAMRMSCAWHVFDPFSKIIVDLIMTDFFTLLVCGIHCVHVNDDFGMRMFPHMCMYPHVAAWAWPSLMRIRQKAPTCEIVSNAKRHRC